MLKNLFNRLKGKMNNYSPIKIIPDGYQFPESLNFDFSVEYALQDEGGLSNDKFDKGGITKYGIILQDLYDLGFHGAVAKNIEDLSQSDAKYIYRKLYWEKLGLDDITSKAISCALFDIGIVRGVGIPPKYCRQIYGSSDLKILNDKNEKEFIIEFEKLCEIGFHQIVDKNPTQKEFIDGWISRAKRLLTLVS